MNICNFDDRITKHTTIPVKPIIEPKSGYNIDGSMVGLSEIVIEADWCKVLHHSTDILIIVILTEPTNTKTAKNLSAFS